jgi:hypothetical protein
MDVSGRPLVQASLAHDWRTTASTCVLSENNMEAGIELGHVPALASARAARPAAGPGLRSCPPLRREGRQSSGPQKTPSPANPAVSFARVERGRDERREKKAGARSAPLSCSGWTSGPLEREGPRQDDHAALPNRDGCGREREIGDLRRPVVLRATRLGSRGLFRRISRHGLGPPLSSRRGRE